MLCQNAILPVGGQNLPRIPRRSYDFPVTTTAGDSLEFVIVLTNALPHLAFSDLIRSFQFQAASGARLAGRTLQWVVVGRAHLLFLRGSGLLNTHTLSGAYRVYKGYLVVKIYQLAGPPSASPLFARGYSSGFLGIVILP